MFVAVAKEDVPQECWFRMGRAHTLAHGSPVLLSWTGTMFEYLMPTLWMRSYPNTLLDRSRIAGRGCQRSTARAKACLGEFRSRPTASSMRQETISTRHSVFPPRDDER